MYDSGTHHIGLEIDARYQLGMHHIGSEISAYYKPSTHHIGLEIAARYQLGIHHIGHEVSQLGERNAIRPRLTIGTDYARDAATTPVAVTTYWRPARTRNTLLASVTPVRSPVRAVKTADTSVYVVTTSAARLVQYRPFARVAGKRTVEIDQLQPFRYFPVNEMLAGQITDQQVYSSQSSAVAAAAALGYALSNITTWWFHTFIEVNGANDVAVAWMWKVPPEITSRDCGSASGLGSKYPIPHKWLVQGG